MCQAKSDGGRRCFVHSVGPMMSSLKAAIKKKDAGQPTKTAYNRVSKANRSVALTRNSTNMIRSHAAEQERNATEEIANTTYYANTADTLMRDLSQKQTAQNEAESHLSEDELNQNWSNQFSSLDEGFAAPSKKDTHLEELQGKLNSKVETARFSSASFAARSEERLSRLQDTLASLESKKSPEQLAGERDFAAKFGSRQTDAYRTSDFISPSGEFMGDQLTAVDDPTQHEALLKANNVPSEHVALVASNTNSFTTYRNAVRKFSSLTGMSFDEAKNTVGPRFVGSK